MDLFLDKLQCLLFELGLILIFPFPMARVDGLHPQLATLLDCDLRCDPDRPSSLRQLSPWLCALLRPRGSTYPFSTKTRSGSIKRNPNRSTGCQLYVLPVLILMTWVSHFCQNCDSFSCQLVSWEKEYKMPRQHP